MNESAGAPPGMLPWLAAEREFAALAAAWAQPSTTPASAEAWLAALADSYRRLFASRVPIPVLAGTAAQRFGALLSSIAQDAARRLASALSESGPGAPSITTLRELRALWIETGEAAWSVAAHGEAFAAAQAELLAALVELRAAGSAR